MWAGRIRRSAADPAGRTGRAAVAQRAEVRDWQSILQLCDVARLGEHVADPVVTIVDLAAVGRDRVREVILHTGQPVEIIIGEGLAISTLVSRGNRGCVALVLNGLDIRDVVERVAEVDELLVEG